MKKQLQGIALILFAIVMMMYSIIDPSVPIFDDILSKIAVWVAVLCGVIGLVLSFKRDD